METFRRDVKDLSVSRGGVARGGTRELGSSKFFGCGPGDLVLSLSKSD